MAMYEGESPFANLFNSEELNDLRIIVNNREIRVHKVLLAAQSRYSSDRFEGNSSLDLIYMEEEPGMTVDTGDASYGFIAWCYGLLYEGDKSTSDIASHTMEEAYFSCNKGEHLSYIADLYVTATKHGSPLLEKHAKDSFAMVLQQCVDEYKEDNELFTLKWPIWVFESVAERVYEWLGDDAKELRPLLAKVVRDCKEDLRDYEEFRKMMVKLPELCFDVLIPPDESVLAGRKRKRGRKQMASTRKKPVEVESDGETV